MLLTGSGAGQTAVPEPPLVTRGTLTVGQVMGQAEVQNGDGVWRPFAAQTTLSSALRTGTGRAILTSRAGRVVVGSASRLRVYSQETDFQEGQFYLTGEVGAFALGSHFVLGGSGRARVDLSQSVSRLAVLAGDLRLVNGARSFNLSAGQQINLKTWQVTTFRETDPWYDAQFAGIGAARVEAVRGTVSLSRKGQGAQDAQIGLSLNESEVLTTGKGSWAELGFSGGGYLRLTEESELRVLAIEKTVRGREVLLQLTRGSAWNVVQKGQGGYRIDTPVVSTAVRGTRFRVDASGLVKVMEGQVALPSEGGTPVSAGEQKSAGQPVARLQLDDLDRFNAAQDVARQQALKVRVSGLVGWAPALKFAVQATPDTALSATLTARGAQGQPLKLVGDSATGQFSVNDPALPEGQYTVALSAQRFGQVQEFTRRVTIDRTAPRIEGLVAETVGRTLLVRGRVSDASPRLTITATSPGGPVRVTHTSGHEFTLLLPQTNSSGLRLSVRDEAGNESNVTLP